MSPEECRRRARHYERLAARAEDLDYSKVLTDIAASWRRLAQPDRAGCAEPAEAAEKVRKSARAGRRLKDVRDSSAPPRQPASSRDLLAGAPRSTSEAIKEAAKARRLVSEVTTRNLRQRLLDLAAQHETKAGMERDVAEPLSE
jgi:hypothetical protein